MTIIMEEENHDKFKLPCFEESNSPWVIYTHGVFNRKKRKSKLKQLQTFCKISGTSNITSYVKTIPQLCNKYILASIHGWLILRDLFQRDMFCMFNPYTFHTIILPPLQVPDDDDNNIKCALRSTPDNRDCLLVLCFIEAKVMFSCAPVDARPDCSWISYPFQDQVSEIFTVKGLIYAVSDLPRRLFYWVDDSLSSFILRPLQIHGAKFKPGPGAFEEFYIESCDCFYYVELGQYYVEEDYVEYVKVFELDFDEYCWREIKSLNGRTFFLGYDCCTWCWGTTNDFEIQEGIPRNCIYLSLVFGSKSMYIYNLNDGSFMRLRYCPNMLNPNDKSPVWLIPQHLRLSRLERLNEDLKELNINCQRVDRIEYNNFEINKLPLHIVEKISKHIHLFDYWNFRATSKLFRSICPTPQWRTNNILPLFLFFKSSGSCELIDPCRHDSCSHAVPFFQDPFIIRFSKNGWILAIVGESLQYFNLFTGIRGDYPNPPFLKDLFLYFCSIAFSTYPTCSECLTIGTFLCEYGFFIVYHESGKEAWNHYCCFNTTFYPSNSCPIFLSGAFYMLDKQGRLGVFQLVNGQASWQLYDKPHKLKKFYASHLVEGKGELYSVFIKNMGKGVQVFRFDKLMKHWIEIEYLENQIFFVSCASSFSVVTKDHKMKNRIYFPMLYKKGVMFYSQDTRNYHSLASDDIIEDFLGATQPLRCCWI